MAGKFRARGVWRALLVCALAMAFGHVPGVAFADETTQQGNAAPVEAVEQTNEAAEAEANKGATVEQVVPTEEPAQDAVVEEVTQTEAGVQVRADESTYSGQSGEYYWVLNGKSLTIVNNQANSWQVSDSSILTHNGNGQFTGTNNTRKIQTVTVTARTGRWQTKEYNVVVLPSTVDGKVYLRNANEVPDNTIQDGAAVDFGPKGNDTPYCTVDVHLDKVLENGGKPYIKTSSKGNTWVYFSIDSETGKGPSTGRKNEAKKYWENVITASGAISETDQAEIDSWFPGAGFFGYVLKEENSGWHIDGVFTLDPPVYLVELYHQVDGKFEPTDVNLASSNNPVSFDDFAKQLAEYLNEQHGVTSIEANGLRFDGSGTSTAVSYTVDGMTYRRTITADEVRSPGSRIYPQDKFGYYDLYQNQKYLRCTLVISEPEKLAGNLSITKYVAGGVANVEDHFTFQLSGVVPDGKYNATYMLGDASSPDVHQTEIEFNGGTSKTEIKLRHNETVTIQGLPANVKVNVKEVDASDKAYTSTKYNTDGSDKYADYDKNKGVDVTVAQSTDATATPAHVYFKNTFDMAPNNGVSISNTTPMVGLLAAAAIGGTALFAASRGKRGVDARKE